MIQGVNIYDRCPSLGVDLIPILDCYMDVAGDRNQDGNIAWRHVYDWCEYFGMPDPEKIVNIVRYVDVKVDQWRSAKRSS